MQKTISARRFFAYSALLTILLAGAGIRLAAQSTTASVLGTVLDSSGAAVPGATITVTNTTTGIAQTAVSDSRGRYLIPSLAVGRYDVKAELQGFQTVIQKSVELTVGSDGVVDFTLR